MSTNNIFGGLRVLDTASFIAAPAAATVLSDFGADVIKLEPPETGDPQRILGSTPPCPRAHANYCWHLANRNKRGIAIDLKAPEAQTILKRLVQWADVIITNYPPRVRDRLHLGYEEVSAWNPRVIYADVSGYGDAGPDAALPGFDLTAYWARSGLLASTRDAGAPPTLPVPGSGDYATAMGLYSAIVTALYHRERTGRGSSVGTSLLAEGVWATGTFVAGALADGTPYGLHDRTAPANALINPYTSSDDRWFLLVATSARWPALAEAIGHSYLAEDARFADADARARNATLLAGLLDAEFRSRPLAHWREVLDRGRITYGIVQTPAETAVDEQAAANDIVVPLEGDDELTHTISSPITVRGTAKVPAHRAPSLGEHTDEVLAGLGFTTNEIHDFRAAGAIAGAPHLEAAR